jgi:hypothetical protein
MPGLSTFPWGTMQLVHLIWYCYFWFRYSGIFPLIEVSLNISYKAVTICTCRLYVLTSNCTYHPVPRERFEVGHDSSLPDEPWLILHSSSKFDMLNDLRGGQQACSIFPECLQYFGSCWKMQFHTMKSKQVWMNVRIACNLLCVMMWFFVFHAQRVTDRINTQVTSLRNKYATHTLKVKLCP